MPKAHWTKGKLRNPDASPLIAELRTFLRDHYERGIVSNRALAAAIAVSESAVRRWLDGTDQPGKDHARHVREWMDRIIEERRRP